MLKPKITMDEFRKILIVEDEMISAYNLAENLEELGYLVSDIIMRGEDVISQVRSNPPDLIFMDIQLDGKMNGIEVTAAIQEYDIPVIYLSGLRDNDTVEAAINTRPYGYLTKPVKFEDIKTTLALALSKHEQDTRVKDIIVEEAKIKQLKSRLLAITAHDLRNPLSIIRISVDILQQYDRELSAAKKSKHFGCMKTAIKNMVRQIDGLLILQQSSEGKLPLRPQPIDAIAFCQDLLEDFQIMTQDKYELQFSSQGDYPEINLDKDLLGQILGNLLSNAIKYSPKGGKIKLTFSYLSKQAIFCIEDQGIGMPAEFLDKLFQPFERGENVGTIQGTGIGLYIVQQAVECHQGDIGVESQVGIGTTFTVTLPTEFVR